jgi:hypothetical protein
VEALVLDRHARRGAGGADQPRVQRRIVQQRRQRPPVALDDGGDPGAAPSPGPSPGPKTGRDG